jgi:hypothetical protein
MSPIGNLKSGDEPGAEWENKNNQEDMMICLQWLTTCMNIDGPRYE